MRITKLNHATLIIEDKKNILFDPGNYTYDDLQIDLDSLPVFDYVIITHEHQDHFYIPFLNEILERNPGATVIATESIKRQLGEQGLQVQTEGNNDISIERAHHEKLLGMPMPENISVTVFDALTHPGDSLQFQGTARVLALPIQAPWGSMVTACEKAIEVSPEFIIPIHDWHWSDKARMGLYQMAKGYFEKQGIKFIEIQNNHPVEF